MQKTPLLIGLFAVASFTLASPTRTEVARPTTTAENTKPNSDAVPEVYAVTRQFKDGIDLRRVDDKNYR